MPDEPDARASQRVDVHLANRAVEEYTRFTQVDTSFTVQTLFTSPMLIGRQNSRKSSSQIIIWMLGLPSWAPIAARRLSRSAPPTEMTVPSGAT